MPKRNKGKRQSNRVSQNKSQFKKHFIDKSGQKNVLRKSKASTNPNRAKDDGNSFYRDQSTIRRLNMYRKKPDIKKMYEQPSQQSRIEPDRKWFGNTRVADQQLLDQYRTQLAQKARDPYTVLVKGRKLPLSILTTPTKVNRANLLEIEPFEQTFGSKSTRKKPKLDSYSFDHLIRNVEEKKEKYNAGKDIAMIKNSEEYQKEIHKEGQRDNILQAGQSKRIWEELYKVIDSSDVIIQVLDARDPQGTRSSHIQNHLKKNHPSKHLVLLLNKCDLVPTWITKRWVAALSLDYPTVAFRASVTNPFGKGSLIQILRQFDTFHKDRKNISVGFVGYPNTGKSSVINSLKSKQVCKSAPIPGETKVWQYITLTKRIYLIDCPGVVYEGVFQEIERNNSNVEMNEVEKDSQVVLRGVVRAERLREPELYIPALLERANLKNLCQVYGFEYEEQDNVEGEQEEKNIKVPWTDAQDFLSQLAMKMGRLRKGGDPDLDSVAKIILCDWQKGKISYFTKPPTFKITNQQKVERRKPKEIIEGERTFLKEDLEDVPSEEELDLDIEQEDFEQQQQDDSDEEQSLQILSQSDSTEKKITKQKRVNKMVNKKPKKGKLRQV